MSDDLLSWKEYYKKNREKVIRSKNLWKKKHRDRVNLSAKKSGRIKKRLKRQEIDRIFEQILTNTRAYLDDIDETELTTEDRLYLRNNGFSMS